MIKNLFFLFFLQFQINLPQSLWYFLILHLLQQIFDRIFPQIYQHIGSCDIFYLIFLYNFNGFVIFSIKKGPSKIAVENLVIICLFNHIIVKFKPLTHFWPDKCVIVTGTTTFTTMNQNTEETVGVIFGFVGNETFEVKVLTIFEF